jgi:hypothetical protein
MTARNSSQCRTNLYRSLPGVLLHLVQVDLGQMERLVLRVPELVPAVKQAAV